MNEDEQKRVDQLRSALAAGLIDQDTYDTDVAAMRAKLQGSGAIAQGPDSLAVGAGSVGVGGDNQGVINLGLLIQQGTRPGASPRDLRYAYLARLLRQANQLPLFGGDCAKAQIRLSSVYTALLTQGGKGARERGAHSNARCTDRRSTRSIPKASSFCSAGQAAARLRSSTSSPCVWPENCWARKRSTFGRSRHPSRRSPLAGNRSQRG
jgi:hypothetical protein